MKLNVHVIRNVTYFPNFHITESKIVELKKEASTRAFNNHQQ